MLKLDIKTDVAKPTIMYSHSSFNRNVVSSSGWLTLLPWGDSNDLAYTIITATCTRSSETRVNFNFI